MRNFREIADHYHMSRADYDLGAGILGSGYRGPDIVIAPDGKPYLYRWHVVPRNDRGNVYFHVQVADDPERPLHDHPWDNVSVILAGGYSEQCCSRRCPNPGTRYAVPTFERRAGNMIFRAAEWGHRLLMLEGAPYTMTLFTTGQKRRRWGFWYPDGWRDADEVCRMDGNVSFHINPEGR